MWDCADTLVSQELVKRWHCRQCWCLKYSVAGAGSATSGCLTNHNSGDATVCQLTHETVTVCTEPRAKQPGVIFRATIEPDWANKYSTCPEMFDIDAGKGNICDLCDEQGLEGAQCDIVYFRAACE